MFDNRKSKFCHKHYENSPGTEHLIQPYDFELIISSRYISSAKKFPKIFAQINIPRIVFHVSDYQVLLFWKYKDLFQEQIFDKLRPPRPSQPKPQVRKYFSSADTSPKPNTSLEKFPTLRKSGSIFTSFSREFRGKDSIGF